MMQGVAVYCCVLQRVAACCSVLQRVAVQRLMVPACKVVCGPHEVCYSALQRVAACCSVL